MSCYNHQKAHFNHSSNMGSRPSSNIHKKALLNEQSHGGHIDHDYDVFPPSVSHQPNQPEANTELTYRNQPGTQVTQHNTTASLLVTAADRKLTVCLRYCRVKWHVQAHCFCSCTSGSTITQCCAPTPGQQPLQGRPSLIGSS